MRFGCFSYDFKRFSLDYAFRIAQRYGFEGLELWGGRPHAYVTDMDTTGIKHILNLKKKYKIDIPMYTPNAINSPYCLCSLSRREQAEALEFFQKSINIASDLEIPRMLVVADHPGYENPLKDCYHRFIDNMKQLAINAQDKGIILVIEPLTPMESPVITTSDDCARALTDISMDNVEAMMDVVPPNIAYEPIGSYFDKLENKMNYIHICNNDGITDAHLRLDNGVIPVIDMLHVIKNREFNGYVTMEFYSENFKDPEILMANAFRILKDFR